jgi:hypothetical protein
VTETVVFRADRGAYLRTNAWLAAGAMLVGMAILAVMGNPHAWTGAVGGLAAIALRAWYVSDEELALDWTLGPTHLDGPTRSPMDDGAPAGPAWRVPLAQIARVRVIGSFVQVVTASGDKHLMKYLADPAAVAARIETARATAAWDATA